LKYHYIRALRMALNNNKEWHAVAIVPKGLCCELVKSLRTSRFLSAQAPRLPLPECSIPSSCNCSYKHYEDRRVSARRSDELHGLRRGHWKNQERRVRTDRRAPE
jgi:hypothetical protein